jgi:hypothetical protein
LWEVNSFDDLFQTYGLAKQDFYRYLQLDYFCKEVKCSDSREPPIITPILIYAYNSGPAKGLIT